MVAETGEGTSKFLHDVVNGNIDARNNQRAQAMRAKDTIGNMPEGFDGTREVAQELVRAFKSFSNVQYHDKESRVMDSCSISSL